LSPKYKLVAFDAAGTLTNQWSTWHLICRYYGVEEECAKLLDAYKNGKITYKECMERDIALWPISIHISKVEEILSVCVATEQGKFVCSKLHEKGIKIALVSAASQVMLNNVARAVNADFAVSNEICFDEKGYVTGKAILNVDPLRKEPALFQAAKDLGIRVDECAAVGDTLYDATLVTSAGLGFILGDKELAESIGAHYITDLTQILEYL
jgi:HAD superfamily PSPase-like hydrolase